VDGFPGELGIQEEQARDGFAHLSFEAQAKHMNQAGTLHGGVLATLVDAAMARAARSTSDDGELPATSQLTLAYLSAGGEGRLDVTAQVRKQSDTVMLCDADVEQDGRTLVHAVATFAVLQR
jgi:uncharacterized protein (TIGR00369 family)